MKDKSAVIVSDISAAGVSLHAREICLWAGAGLVTTIFFYVGNEFMQIPAVVVALACALCLVTAAISVPLSGWAPVCLLRTITLGAPGIISAGIIIFTEYKLLFTPSAMAYQTDALAIVVLLLTTLAVMASTLGYGLGMLPKPVNSSRVAPKDFKFRFFSYAAICIISGSFSADGLGGFVWSHAYQFGGIRPFLNIGVFTVFSAFSVLGMYIVLMLNRELGGLYKATFLICAVYSLLFCLFFRGARLDVYGACLAMYFVTLEWRRVKPKLLRLFFYGALLFVTAQAWAFYRAHATNPWSPAEFVSRFLSNFHHGTTEQPLIHLPTIDDIAANLFQIVGMVHDKEYVLMHGKSYLDYIPRTLPHVLYPGRPRDFTANGGIHGHFFTGSQFELCEAYANFGMLGCIFIPGLLTFLMAKIYRHVSIDRSFYPILAYGICIALILRGTWYQTFSFYKSPLAWFFVEVCIFIAIKYKSRYFASIKNVQAI